MKSYTTIMASTSIWDCYRRIITISRSTGVQSLVDLLNQQQKLFQAQIQYTVHRYTLINDYLTLKQATGVLGFQDLLAVNALLSNECENS